MQRPSTQQRDRGGPEQRAVSRLLKWSGSSQQQFISLPQVAALLVVWTIGVIGLSSWWLHAPAPDMKTTSSSSSSFAVPVAGVQPVSASAGRGGHKEAVKKFGPQQALQQQQQQQPPSQQHKLEDELLASLEMVALEVSSKQQYDPTNVEPDDGNEFRCVSWVCVPVHVHVPLCFRAHRDCVGSVCRACQSNRTISLTLSGVRFC